MSANLYKSAAGAEAFGFLVYLVAAGLTGAFAFIHWGSAWTPMLAGGCAISLRLALCHWRERVDLLKIAKEIEDEQTKS